MWSSGPQKLWPFSVSIPLWCDCDLPGGRKRRKPWPVSIPLWCDCDWKKEMVNRYAEAGFNPTMVRLRPLQSQLVAEFKASFNPTMVRLRLVQLLPNIYYVIMFQSHYGAIATSFRKRLRTFSQCFNPTMVRLRRSRIKLGMRTHNSFNPTMVRLRLCISWAASTRAASFNPTMVRLRPYKTSLSKCIIGLVSIPLWCDCDVPLKEGKGHPAQVSIPLWCDCDGTRQEH